MDTDKSRRRTPANRQSSAIGYLLNRTAHIVAATFTDELRNDAITLPLWRVLSALGDSDNQSLSELATHAGAELSHLSRLVASAEAQGLVTRVTSPLDKRSTSVSITTRGRALVRKFSPRAEALESVWLDGISDHDAEIFRRTLRAIYSNVLASQSGSSSTGRKLKVARRVNGRALLEQAVE